MRKNYFFSGLAIAVCVFALVSPAYAIDLRFKSFFDKFTPAPTVGRVLGDFESVLPIDNQAQPLQPINSDNSNNNPPPAICRVGDAEVPCPGVNNSQQPNQPSQSQQSNQQGQPGQQGPSDEQIAKQQAQQLKDMKRGLKPLKNAIAAFEKLMAKGNTLSDALKAKISQAKELAAKIEGAKTADEISNDDMDTLRELMNDLQEQQQSMRRLSEFRRNIANTERGVKNFESQLARLQKQKLIIPADVTANLDKIKQLIATVKTAKSWEEMQVAGVEDMGDLMDTLNQSRNNLEMLARWPQTLKQMDKEITNLNRQVKKAKSTIDRLLKKGIDLADNYNKFVEMADKLKAARSDAAVKMIAGDSESAFNAAQDDFFSQIEETYQNMRVIEIMSNLGTFTSSFKSELNKAKQQINQLKKKKIDTAELQAIFDETQAKGNETLALIKIKPIDEEAIIAAMEEMGNLRVEFGNKAAELQGDDVADMPWEQGRQQFKSVQMAPNFDQYFPQQQQQQPISGGSGGQTCNINGVETPGACQQ